MGKQPVLLGTERRRVSLAESDSSISATDPLESWATKQLASLGEEAKIRYTPWPMKRFRSFISLAASLMILALVFPRSAHAYVDPGTGSYVLQIVIAGIAAASFSLKLFWGRIRAFFSGPPPEKEDSIDSDE